jgi:hypothetical protein
MVSQTRRVLEKYANAGGIFREVVMEDTGHAPFIENLDIFNKVFHPHLITSTKTP